MSYISPDIVDFLARTGRPEHAVDAPVVVAGAGEAINRVIDRDLGQKERWLKEYRADWLGRKAWGQDETIDGLLDQERLYAEHLKTFRARRSEPSEQDLQISEEVADRIDDFIADFCETLRDIRWHLMAARAERKPPDQNQQELTVDELRGALGHR